MNLIINIDGGSRGNPGPGASGWVIKDAKSKILERGGLFFKECTNNHAEFMALQMALERAVALGGKKLIIKSDSQLLVKQYSGEYKIKNPHLKDLMADIKAAASNFTKITLTHVPREQNKEADAMCNEIMDKALKKKPAKATTTKPSSAKTSTVKKQPAKPAAVKKPAKQAPVQLELFDSDSF